MPIENQNSAKETETDFTIGQDERKEEEAGKYPYYMSYKSRSGHNFIFDDTKDHESVTLQHRGGSAVQMRSDGSLHITAHNGQYTVTFGENRMTISGAHDITVKGDCSLRVYGDYNVTCHKNYNLTVMGDFNLTAKNHNRHIRGNIDTQAKNETKKFEGSSATLAGGGIAKVGKGPVSMISQGGSAHFGGKEGVNVAVTGQGKMTFRNEQGDINVSAKQGEIQGRADKNIKLSSLSGNFDVNATKVAITAKQMASVKGQITAVDGQTTNINGGMALNAAQAIFERVAGGPATQTRDEPDHIQEVSKWV